MGAWADATLPPAAAVGHPGVPAVAAVAALNRLYRGDLAGADAVLDGLPDDPVARHAYEVSGDPNNDRGELDASRADFRRAELLARQVDDVYTALHSRMSRAMVVGYAGQVDEGLQLVQAVRREAAGSGLEVVTAWCDFTVAELVAEQEPGRALDLIDRTVERADRAGWGMLAGVGRLTASSLRARTTDPQDAIPGFEQLIRHWAWLGDDTHQWTTLRNLVDLLIRLGAYAPAARLLGAVGTAPRPTFGAEQERLEAARATAEFHLGSAAGELIRAGREEGLAAAVDHGLRALEQLRVPAARTDGA
jgi:hypothetical protein